MSFLQGKWVSMESVKQLQMSIPILPGIRFRYWIQVGLALVLVFSMASASIASQVMPPTKTISSVTASAGPDVRLANGGIIATDSTGGSEFIWRTLQAIGAIIIIAGLGIGGFILVRKYAPGVIPGTDARMKVLTRIPIGNRQSMIIVRVGERVLVVGSSPGRIDCLSEITDIQEVKDLSYGLEFCTEINKAKTGADEDPFELPSGEASESQDVSNEIQWLRDRLDGYGDRVEEEIRT